VCAARRPGDTIVREEACVCSRYGQVVVLDRDRREDVGDVALALRASAAVRKLDPDEELGGRYGRHRDVVCVVDCVVERAAAALGVDDDRGIDDQSFQLRSSTCNAARS
jgi:hypothetical protein